MILKILLIDSFRGHKGLEIIWRVRAK